MPRRLAAVITSAFLVGAAGSMLWGQTTSPSPIRACVARDGTTRILLTAGACKSQETPVQWNSVGPEGPEGPQGPAGTDGVDGVDGETGPRGPSDAYVVNAGLATNVELCDQVEDCPGSDPATGTHVTSLIVPAGEYTIAAKLVLSNWEALSPALSFCYLHAGSDLIDALAAGTSLDIPYVPGALQGARVFTTSQTLSIHCKSGVATELTDGLTSAQNWQLMATKVATVNAQ